MLTRVIFNQKGGVGKSSIAVNLAAISAHAGFRTLLIDLDTQGNASQYLLGEKAITDSKTPTLTPNIETFFAQTLQAAPSTSSMLFAFPFGSGSTGEVNLPDCIHATDFDNLYVIPSSASLGNILHQLESKHKIYKLRDGLKRLTQDFDRVYIDTPPAFNFFSLSALIAADRVIVPFDCDVFSKRALQSLVHNVLETRQDHNPDLGIEGIVVNQFDPRANLPRQVVQSLMDEGYPIFDAKLSPSVLMKQSHQLNLPLIYLEPNHKLSQQFLALFQQLEPHASLRS